MVWDQNVRWSKECEPHTLAHFAHMHLHHHYMYVLVVLVQYGKFGQALYI